jgi:hypothetical protein
MVIRGPSHTYVTQVVLSDHLEIDFFSILFKNTKLAGLPQSCGYSCGQVTSFLFKIWPKTINTRLPVFKNHFLT